MGIRNPSGIRITRTTLGKASSLPGRAPLAKLNLDRIFQLPLNDPKFRKPSEKIARQFPKMVENLLAANPTLAVSEKGFSNDQKNNRLFESEFPVPENLERGFPTTIKFTIFRSRKESGESEINMMLFKNSGPPETPHMYSMNMGTIDYTAVIGPNTGKLLENLDISRGEHVIEFGIYAQRILRQLLDSNGDLELPA